MTEYNREYARAYYLKHRKKILARAKAWNKKNHDKYKAYMKAYKLKKKKRAKENAVPIMQSNND